jgi:hypothetical protein
MKSGDFGNQQGDRPVAYIAAVEILPIARWRWSEKRQLIGTLSAATAFGFCVAHVERPNRGAKLP